MPFIVRYIEMRINLSLNSDIDILFAYFKTENEIFNFLRIRLNTVQQLYGKYKSINTLKRKTKEKRKK